MKAPRTKASIDRIRSILAKFPAAKDDTADLADCQEHNWLVPNYFATQELEKVDSFCKSLAEQIKKNFRKYYKQTFEVELDSFSQLFSDNLVSESSENDYCLHFTNEPGNVFGFVDIPQNTALTWARQLLGDSGEAESRENPQLSSLETSLLYDISAEAIYALSAKSSQNNIKPQGCVTENKISMGFEQGLEISKISCKLSVEDSQNPLVFSFIMPAEHLSTVIFGSDSASVNAEPSNFKNMIAGSVEKVIVPLGAVLCRQVFSLDDLLSLEVDDVLLLNKQIDQTVDLYVDRQDLFAGTLVKNQGNYAVRINNIKKP